jgi:hypothetical protein
MDALMAPFRLSSRRANSDNAVPEIPSLDS